MMRTAVARLAAKEARALLPLWAGCTIVVGACAAVDRGDLDAWGMLIYVAGSLALGSLSIGHEYAHHTLPALLTQPIRRSRVLATKLAVLTLMLLMLAAVAWSSMLYRTSGNASLVMLTVLSGLLIAPWLTMLSRNPLAGTLFTIGIGGVFWILVAFSFAEAIQMDAFRRLMLGLCALAGVMSWFAFTRLEVIDGGSREVQFTRRGSDRPAVRRHHVWTLVNKELALQQLSFAIAGVYALAWLVEALFRLVAPTRALQRTFEDPLGVLTPLYSGLIAMLIGSLASAEERQLGTREWQLLLPIASSQQWMVKAGVALVLATGLAAGLPALLLSSSRTVRIDEWYLCAMVLLTSVSLYVSSLNSSGMRALLLSIPASLCVLVPIGWLVSSLGRIHLTLVPGALLTLFLAEALYFGLLNHRSAERRVTRIGQQLFSLAGCMVLVAVVLTLVHQFHIGWLR